MKSTRNKTLALSPAEEAAYSARCLRPAGALELHEALDRTLCGDCFALMPLLPRGFARLIIADPPYNLSRDYDGGSFRKMDPEEYGRYTARWLDLALPLLSPEGSVYVCCDWRCSWAVERELGRRLTLRSRITWQREKGRGAARNWKNAMEDIWFATAGEHYTFNLDAVKQRRRVIAPYTAGGKPKDWEETPLGRFRDTCPSNFWDDLTVPYWSMAENTQHPTQKPEKLLARLILASSNPGDVVFDPFLGSGTTAVTAKKLGRHYIGIERSGRYCAWVEKRLEKAETDKRIQGYEDGVFWERNSGK